MSAASESLGNELRLVCGERLVLHDSANNEITAEVPTAELLAVALQLRDAPSLKFNLLIDVAGVDYLDYGRSEWQTEQASGSGFSRGVNEAAGHTLRDQRRFAVVYQLLSLTHNRRMRLRAWCEGEEDPAVDSVTGIWASANWFEREAFDLFGILFRNHPDLRRLLTDYGFIGHPFRKDFPLIGNVEVRYDAERKRVVYEPVSIEPRTLVPRVIRHDNRYEEALKGAPAGGARG
ncbi:MAG TPA: NADH-quinone oxidoreductase subunit C [Steroidobacteraceae bacterium]|jgi:NADH-quinone oxidoreductase subunit C|nr:NADH-quinone oxidoreductase subunit C [Steroidobacteraceae bacterium]